MEDFESKQVKVYYCKCGKSIEFAVATEFITGKSDKAATTKKFNEALRFGRKVETMTLAEYRKIPFMCDGATDCPDSN